MVSAGVSLLNTSLRRDTEWFIDELRGVSAGNLRLLWIPSPQDTTTNALKPDGRVHTNSATIQGRITYQGNGILVSFNGTDQYGSTPDTDDLSFGNGTTDSPFSVVALASVTDTAAARNFLSKDNAAGSGEWAFRISAGDKMQLALSDASAGVGANKVSTASITHVTPTLFTGVYDGRGGADAADGITYYQNTTALAGTAFNNASYVAMENGSVTAVVGAASATGGYMSGSMGFVAVYAAALTAVQVARIRDLCREYYGVAL